MYIAYLFELFHFERKPKLMHSATGRREKCAIAHEVSDGGYQLSLTSEALSCEVSSHFDFEESLQALWDKLEEHGLVLLINRYRRNAFVTHMSRDMSDGLGCYLVRMGRPVRPRQIVSSLAGAPKRTVGTRREAEEFGKRWLASLD